MNSDTTIRLEDIHDTAGLTFKAGYLKVLERLKMGLRKQLYQGTPYEIDTLPYALEQGVTNTVKQAFGNGTFHPEIDVFITEQLQAFHLWYARELLTFLEDPRTIFPRNREVLLRANLESHVAQAGRSLSALFEHEGLDEQQSQLRLAQTVSRAAQRTVLAYSRAKHVPSGFN